MPTVGTRRSTRVFVPNKHHGGDPARVLRSGKRFALSMNDDEENEWIGSDLNRWWLNERKIEWKELRQELEKKGIEEKVKKKFGTVYARKRRRSEVSNNLTDSKDLRRFGIVFERKILKKDQKVAPLVERACKEASIGSKTETKFRIAECSNIFVEKLGILDTELFNRVKSSGSVILAVVMDLAVGYSLNRFKRFLVSVMNWMRRVRVDLWDLVGFLCCRSIGNVFAMNGIHFLPIRHQTNRIWDRNSVSGCGLCKIYGSGYLVPLLSVDYSVLPSYFKSLNEIIILGSQYLPGILYLQHLIPVPENSLISVPCETHVFGDLGDQFTVSETPFVGTDEPTTLRDSFTPASRSSVIINGSRLHKPQKKRRSLNNSIARKRTPKSLDFGLFYSSRSSSSVSLVATHKFAVGPVSGRPLDYCLSDLCSAGDESDAASSLRCCSKLRKALEMKSSIEKIKVMRLALAEVRHNIDSAWCNANILVTDAEKCWREDGARVVLETSGSHECYIVVKKGDITRFLHKPQDLKPCVVNRFTHAYMWSGDDSWKLEFCDEWDWRVFKELHMECRDRNIQDVSVKVIPVPGVREVSGYDDDAMSSFTRPDIYIHIVNDEVGRALASGASYYDMDAADEEWLRHLNSSSPDALSCGSSFVSEENFEKIVSTLEKGAYGCPDEAFDKEKALDLCHGLGTGDLVSAIYDYWLKKRRQRCAPLARVFQGPPLRRTPFIRKPFLRKKRSFKRQRSQSEWNQTACNQAWRSKPDLFLQAHQEAVRKVQEAEAAASRATKIAIQLRTRAQLLMTNADLAAYKAAMTLRVAEIIHLPLTAASDTPYLVSSILFD